MILAAVMEIAAAFLRLEGALESDGCAFPNRRAAPETVNLILKNGPLIQFFSTNFLNET